ncbi:MAG TPA: crosslink repair DNA glycosylase YcaQ family protein [Verrucomicrobiae bacterium]|nr:crosslink repair DNA glycosylase YcaQ family protein [Verrucomicrobiae bacterium]
MGKPQSLTLAALRRYAVARTLFAPTTLARAIDKLGFVQADPIRAPARAQDLTLRHRVRGYRAGDLERLYPKLSIEEDFFINYGFLPRDTQALMHPRVARKRWSKSREDKANALLAFVRARGVTHPRDVDTHFKQGKVRNWFGGSTNASTQLLDEMHYRGLVRISGRQGGTRLYTARETTQPANPQKALDALVDVIVCKYAPLPERSLSELVSKLRGGAPQWALECRPALHRARARLSSADVDGIRWYWPIGENPAARKWVANDDAPDCVRLLAPFDPVVWDRRRFEFFWNWSYRFEAYTPAAKRLRGYYALPLLWRDEIIGWGNLSVAGGDLNANFGYVSGSAPRDRDFKRALDEELRSIRFFLGLT